ncbi:DNA replication and repair protein RecF [Coriobacterium glomerans PW2]|uniref:DNA replication and repair protein RecF n=1 Tax=Coriobacterium glomerans (strain ATCC 49209 / DSM 20642 / JCM 10262 / PW2) TaxID=700015 RepID=F2N6T6_CORGP|nr:DNA replication and repair protein RecF [Coriobacterium glomerans]AEB06135.1 DNA replication and repair protein RecF [Coriobacterium glomerans PW2]
MGVLARSLRLRDYRSFERFSLDLDPGTTVLSGRNAVGKTNLIEALQLLTFGQSFRKASPSELIRDGAERAVLDLNLSGGGRDIDLGLVATAGKRAFSRNGKPCRASSIRGVMPSVLFCPDHLDMVKRSAGVRRGALDDFGTQLSARYAQLVGSYGRIVEQRNALLRDVALSDGLLDAWDDALIETGCALIAHRISLLARLRAAMRRIHASIAPGEQMDVGYRASICPTEDLLTERADRATLERRYRGALAAARPDEIRRCVSLMGPHRDEIAFTVAGRDARSFASQGQQRTLVLSWKIAEVDVACEILGAPPLLLLDDVMSELDEPRRSAVMEFVEEGIQTVISTTNLGYFSSSMLRRAKVVTIGNEREKRGEGI